jgi:hypothetical protein
VNIFTERGYSPVGEFLVFAPVALAGLYKNIHLNNLNTFFMKISYRPVSVPKYAFVFCRYLVTVLVWLAFFLRDWKVLALAGAIMLFSAVFKIRRAPLILLYKYTFGAFLKSPAEIVNENAMRFAHIMATIISAISLLLVFVAPTIGWMWVFGFAVFKTFSAVGFCPASKLYECAGNGKCCAFSKSDMSVKKTC